MNRSSQRRNSVCHTLIVLALIVPVLGTSPVAAHGSSSLEEDSCVRWIDSSRVHFNAYRPDLDPMSHYCDEIPELGSTLVVVDLVDPMLRTIPTSLSVFRIDNNVAGDEMLRLPARTYPTGVIEASIEFPTAGRYIAEVSTADDEEHVASFLLRVGDQGFQLGVLIQRLVLLLLFAFIVFRLYKRWRPNSQPTVA